MDSKQKTAVEWLIDNLPAEMVFSRKEIIDIFAKAKQMEKKQRENDMVDVLDFAFNGNEGQVFELWARGKIDDYEIVKMFENKKE